MVDRSNRESATREKQERRKAWTPPSQLDAPPAPIGYKHRWIRERVMDYDDKANIYKRQREGYELVRAEDYPDSDYKNLEPKMQELKKMRDNLQPRRRRPRKNKK